MNPKIKLAAYAVLTILAIWFAWGFYSNYSAVSEAAKQAQAATEDLAANPSNAEAPATDTNTPAQTTNATQGTNVATAASDTNQPAQSTNSASAHTNAAPASAASAPKSPPPTVAAERASMITYLAALVGSVIGLGLLIAYDVTHLVGQQAVDFLFNDVGDGIRDPEYERAEQVWANGQLLEAIQMMRDYLKKNPRQLHAALRIAEIYEKDLHNYLAAALEYEEVIKHKLPAERWGWAAIHLCNLYSRLGQPEKTLALLHRIVDEYPQTAAAKKARTRLGLSDLEEEPTQEVEASSPPPPPPPLEPEPPSNLPPGFRPKK